MTAKKSGGLYALTLWCIAAAMTASAVRAEDYPARVVKIVVPFPAGGAVDIVARTLADELGKRWSANIVIENRPGAGGTIAADATAKAPADGYTLLMVGGWNAINATLYEKLNFNFISDIAPVAGIIRFPNVMVVNPSVPAKTVPEFIAYAKANPGRLNMASSGNGSTIHVSGELFKMMTGVNMIHVPYRGGAPALTDMISGQVQVMFDNVPTSIEFIRAGKLRALAVTTATRSEVLPDLPTVADFVPGYEASAWYGVGVPKGTPDDIIKMTVWITDRSLREIMNRHWVAMFPDPHSRPARHTLTSRDFTAPMQIQCDLMGVLGEG